MSLIRFTLLHFLQFIICGAIGVYLRFSRIDHSIDYLGDVKPVRDGVSEMRIDVGAGYRVYYTVRERVIIILLIGGNKSTQSTDIKKAVAMAKEI